MLNPTQKKLAEEFFEDRISPCILDMIFRCKQPQTKEKIISLILMPSKYRISKQDSDAFFSLLLTEGFPKYITHRLRSLFNLYQSENEKHLFIAPILDERFFCRLSCPVDFKTWIDNCKIEILTIYTSRINQLLEIHEPEYFKKISNAIIIDPEFLDSDNPSINRSISFS